MKIEIDAQLLLIIGVSIFFIHKDNTIRHYPKYIFPRPHTQTLSKQEPTGTTQNNEILLEHSGFYYLYVLHKEHIPGINPLIFTSYEEYVRYCKLRQSNGIYTQIQCVFKKTKENNKSINAMDTNWGGIEYSRSGVMKLS